MHYFLLPSLLHSQPFMCCHTTCQHTPKKAAQETTSSLPLSLAVTPSIHQINPNPLHWYGIQEKFEQDCV